MALSQGLWSDYSVVLFPVLSVATAIIGAIILRISTNTRDKKYHVFIIPILSLISVIAGMLALENTVWFWYFTGGSIVAGASVSLGIAHKQRHRFNEVYSAVIIAAGIVIAAMLSSIEIEWVLMLAAILGVFGITAGFLLTQTQTETVTEGGSPS